MTEGDAQARLAVLAEVGLLGPLRREMGRSAGPGLHVGTAGALWQLSDRGPLRLGELATGLRVDVSVVSRQVADLVQAGFVDRHPDPADGRACLLSLSPRGRDALAEVTDRVEERFRDALRGWSREDLARVAADLRRLRQDLLPDGRDSTPATSSTATTASGSASAPATALATSSA